MKLTENFYLYEFESKDGAEMPIEVAENISILVEQLQFIRDYVNKPITINSAYRSPEHNKAIKGSKRSQHLSGKAADIVVKDIKPKDVANLIEYLMDNEYILPGGIGRYDTFTHYDIRGIKTLWNG